MVHPQEPEAPLAISMATTTRCGETRGGLYEGGVRVPFIVQWKGGDLPEGTTYDRPVSSLDVLPTSLAVAGANPPAGNAVKEKGRVSF